MTKSMSLFKSDLINNKIVARTDLMKLYKPPAKHAQNRSNNPFYTNQILQMSKQQLDFIHSSMIRDSNNYSNSENNLVVTC